MHATTHAGHSHDVHSDSHHYELNFWQKYIFSSDHKTIGIQYGVMSLLFLLMGFILMMMMRWSIAFPNEALPIMGNILHSILGDEVMPAVKDTAGNIIGYAMGPDVYNSFGAMHGTIMVFLAIVPLAFAAFGNYVVPLQIGAVDMAFPRVNMASFQCFFLGGVVMFASFFIRVARLSPAGPPIHRWPRWRNVPTRSMARPSGFWAWCSSSPRPCSAR